ncbi:MAG: hypothetical protein ACR2LI_06085 [Propionibacteriaceae bacterium]
MADFITTDRLVQLEVLAYRFPPSWTRLEPQSTSGDPRPGIEARVHDPLWLLGRQWQLGELEGEDAGTPLAVRVVTTTTPVDRWAAGDDPTTHPLGTHDLLEPLVEAEGPPALDRGPGLRARAEAGSALVAALADLGLDDFPALRQALTDHAALDLDPAAHPDGEHAALDPTWLRLTRLLTGRGVVDGELACRALEEAAGSLPAWAVLGSAVDAAAALTGWQQWADWYRADVAPVAPQPDAWVGDRLEYRFRIAAGSTVLDAPAHGGGEIGWHSFDAAPDAVLTPAAGADPPPVERRVHALLASPLRYPGMPADRLWELEDNQVNLGLVQAEPWDLARLLVAEFALTYGNDWLVVPLDVPYGSLTTVESVLYTTTFGERFVVRPTDEVSPDGHWQMYAVTAPPTRGPGAELVPGAAIDGLLIPPGAVAVRDGAPYEEVLFLRDAMANLAWAVERQVQGPSGLARDRGREATAPSPGPGEVATATLDYLLQSSVPQRWIPYLPRTSGYRSIELVQGAMTDAEQNLIRPEGRLLTAGDVQTIKDAEIPREGVAVRRVPSVTRRADGGYVCWTTRRVTVGRGEGSSQLAFDGARPRKPHPNAQLDQLS